MTAAAEHSRRQGVWVWILAAVITYAVTRVGFALVGFRFSPFERPVDLSKFAVDFGVWAVVFLATLWAVNRALMRSSRK